jgi:hypothetical protein
VLAVGGARLSGSQLHKTGTISVSRSFGEANDRETGKKLQMRHDIDRFPPKSRCRFKLSSVPHTAYRAPSDMPVCGDRQFDIILVPAETTRWLKVL